MITTSNTQQRIIKAMKHGATLVFHCCRVGSWNDGFNRVTKVTLERGGRSITLSAQYREDEYHYVPWHEDGACWLRHGEYSQPLTGKDIANQVIEQPEIWQRHACGEYSNMRWHEVYVHINQPEPLWVTEQWNDVYQS